MGTRTRLGGRRDGVVRWMVAAGLAVLVSLPVVVVQAASAEAAPELELSPQPASPGDSVTATARGFEGCSRYVYGDSEAVSITFAWDEVPVTSQMVTDGRAVATFPIPQDASPGQHSVSATCDQDSELTVSASLSVSSDDGSPTPNPVSVPDVVGKSPTEATAELEAAGLTKGRLLGAGGIVQRQSPVAEALVPVGTQVDLVLGSPPPGLVAVPKVVGLVVDKAVQRLVRGGLTLGRTSSQGGVVIAQEPTAFTHVERGSAVDVTLGHPTPQPPEVTPRPRLVSVPRLVGMEVDAVERALARVGLRLRVPPPARDGTVVEQQPAAGVLVPRRTLVTVSLGGAPGPTSTPPSPPTSPPVGTGTSTHTSTHTSPPTPTSTPTGTPAATARPAPTPTLTPSSGTTSARHPTSLLVVVVAAAAALLLGGATAAQHVVRGRRSVGWVHAHVRAVPGEMSVDRPRSEVPQGSRRRADVAVRIEPHADNGTHLIEETTP